ncbi:PfkB family carbohydrate kinase [Thermus sp.]|uniref:PfkB family carbohydrate kinase n=1 Tax=Thermus sp. TaxID=275 RepID=UPI0039A66CDB
MGGVLAVGWACLDHRFHVEAWPPLASRTPVRSYREALGGPAAVAAWAVARLGGEAHLLSRRGHDPAGERLETLLKQAGVRAVWSLGEETAVSGVLVLPSGERYIFAYPGRLPLQPPPGWQGLLQGAGAVLVDLRWPQAALGVLREAKLRGLPRVLDLDRWGEGVRELASEASHIVASAEVGSLLGGIRGLASRFPQAFVALTQGEEGVVWEGGRLPALGVCPKDTTGAGDVFHGAFALGLAWGLGEEGSLRLANVAAGLHVQKGEPPVWEEVKGWL